MAHGASSDTHGDSLRAIFFPLDWLKLKKVAKIADFDAPEGVKFSNETQNFHENSQFCTFRSLKMYCDTFELSFDVRCKWESLAHRLVGIALCDGTCRHSYGRLNSCTAVRNIGVCGAFFVKKWPKIGNLPLCRMFRTLKNVSDTFELSLDVRCKVETLAHRLMGIAARYGNYRRSCGYLNSCTVVSNKGENHVYGDVLV